MTNSPCFVILQDLGDSCYLRCRECKTEFWSDATGENCLVDYIDRTFGFCCPDCGNTNARRPHPLHMSISALLDEMRSLSRERPSDIRYTRFVDLFYAFDTKVKTMSFLKEEAFA